MRLSGICAALLSAATLPGYAVAQEAESNTYRYEVSTWSLLKRTGVMGRVRAQGMVSGVQPRTQVNES